MLNLLETLSKAMHLSKYETKIYITGTSYGYTTLTQLAKAANIPRTAAYPPIQALVKRGLISSIKIGKRTHYKTLAPQQLKYLLEKDKADVELVVNKLIQNIEAPQNDTSIQYFPGISGVEIASEILLNNSGAKIWRTVENPKDGIDKLGTESFDLYTKRRIKKKIFGRAIIPSNSKTPWIDKRIEKSKEELLDIIVVSENLYPIKGSLTIAGDYILLMTIKNNPFAILIKNRQMAQTFETLHNIAWDRYNN